MHLKVNKGDIIEGLQKSANIIPAKTGAAYLRTIWLKVEDGRLMILSTDSNLEFSGSYKAEIIEPGTVGVAGRSFYDLIKRLPAGEITLKLDDETKNLLIEQKSRKYKLPTNDPTWFQNFSEFPENGTVFWAGDFLQDLIDRISFCISDEDTMEAIACMSMKPMADSTSVEVCGLNGHQFAMFRFLHDDLHAMLPEEGILVQKKYLTELRKWLTSDEIELSISNKRLFFRTQDKSETFSLPLSYYQYPNYHNFLAKLNEEGNGLLKTEKDELADSLDRLSIFNTDNNRCTYLDLSAQELALSTQGQDVGSANETLAATYSGDLPKIAFPTRNLIDILGHYESKELSFTITGGEGPCGIQGEDDPDYVVIIMPMKIVEETYYSEEEA